MAKKERVFWLGKGQVRIDKKKYKQGEELPVDKIDKDKLKEWKSAKPPKVGTAPFHVPDQNSDNAKDKDIKLLQGRVADLEKEKGDFETAVKESGDKIAGLELDIFVLQAGDETELKKQIIELDSEVKRLSGVESDNEEKATLIGKQKEEIKVLKKAAKEAAK